MNPFLFTLTFILSFSLASVAGIGGSSGGSVNQADLKYVTAEICDFDFKGCRSVTYKVRLESGNVVEAEPNCGNMLSDSGGDPNCVTNSHVPSWLKQLNKDLTPKDQ